MNHDNNVLVHTDRFLVWTPVVVHPCLHDSVHVCVSEYDVVLFTDMF